jgi:hypothetical protein
VPTADRLIDLACVATSGAATAMGNTKGEEYPRLAKPSLEPVVPCQVIITCSMSYHTVPHNGPADYALLVPPMPRPARPSSARPVRSMPGPSPNWCPDTMPRGAAHARPIRALTFRAQPSPSVPFRTAPQSGARLKPGRG